MILCLSSWFWLLLLNVCQSCLSSQGTNSFFFTLFLVSIPLIYVMIFIISFYLLIWHFAYLDFLGALVAILGYFLRLAYFYSCLYTSILELPLLYPTIFWYIAFSFSFNSVNILISSMIFSMTHWSLKSILYNFQVFV